jgi:hypothetical protein
MLCSVGWTLTHVRRLRGAYMQLELFPTSSQPPKTAPVWEKLSQRERASLIAALARLMSTAIEAEQRRDNDER